MCVFRKSVKLLTGPLRQDSDQLVTASALLGRHASASAPEPNTPDYERSGAGCGIPPHEEETWIF